MLTGYCSWWASQISIFLANFIFIPIPPECSCFNKTWKKHSLLHVFVINLCQIRHLYMYILFFKKVLFSSWIKSPTWIVILYLFFFFISSVWWHLVSRIMSSKWTVHIGILWITHSRNTISSSFLAGKFVHTFFSTLLLYLSLVRCSVGR